MTSRFGVRHADALRDPQRHTLKENATSGFDWTGYFAGELPDGQPWWFADYFTEEVVPVDPAIVHAMRSNRRCCRRQTRIEFTNGLDPRRLSGVQHSPQASDTRAAGVERERWRSSSLISFFNWRCTRNLANIPALVHPEVLHPRNRQCCNVSNSKI